MNYLPIFSLLAACVVTVCCSNSRRNEIDKLDAARSRSSRRSYIVFFRGEYGLHTRTLGAANCIAPRVRAAKLRTISVPDFGVLKETCQYCRASGFFFELSQCVSGLPANISVSQ